MGSAVVSCPFLEVCAPYLTGMTAPTFLLASLQHSLPECEAGLDYNASIGQSSEPGTMDKKKKMQIYTIHNSMPRIKDRCEVRTQVPLLLICI